MSPEVSLASIMLSSLALLVGLPVWLYLLQNRRYDWAAALMLFPAFAFIPIYNLVYLGVAGLIVARVVRKDPTPLFASPLEERLVGHEDLTGSTALSDASS